MASHVTYSEQTAGIIDQEVKDIVETSLQKARKLLKENKKLLDNMARLLVERETIFSEEVDMLMEGKTVEEIMQFMDDNERTLRENPFARKSRVIVPDKKEETTETKETKEETAENSVENQPEETKEEAKEVKADEKDGE